MPLRIHLTSGKVKTSIRNEYDYDVTYCGESFASFSGEFEHSVYLVIALQRLVNAGAEHQLCPDCLESDEYAMDMLTGEVLWQQLT